jgi:hypothetical protein
MGLAHQGMHFILLQLADMLPEAATTTECHCAEAKFGNVEAGAAETVVLHARDAP